MRREGVVGLISVVGWNEAAEVMVGVGAKKWRESAPIPQKLALSALLKSFNLPSGFVYGC